MTRYLMISGALVLLMYGSGTAWAEKSTPQQLQAAARDAGSVNGLCPIMGRMVTPKGGSAVYQSEKIAFCCPGCAKKFQADPTRYMDRMRLNPAKYGYTSKKPTVAVMRKAKSAAGTANGRCPVMGQPVTVKGGSATFGKERIGFCCPPCVAKFKKDAKRYMRLMRADPTAYSYDRPGPTNAQLRAARKKAGSANGLCPVMGRAVTATGGAVNHRGQKIAFCCPGCSKKFQSNPESYLARMRDEPAAYGYLPGPKPAQR